MSAPSHENIGRLDVSVDDAFRVSSVKTLGNLDGQRQNQLGFHWPPGNSMLERLPIQKLHRNEWLALVLANFVDRANVRMIQGGRRLGFALKATEGLRVFGYIVGQEFESRKAAEFQVLGFVNDAHPTAAEFFHDAVVRDRSADERLELRHLSLS